MMIRISVIQFRPALGNPVANMDALEIMFEKAGGSDLVVLPELANSGYAFSDKNEALPNSEVLDGQGVYQQFLQAQAARHQCHIVSGICERMEESLYNSAVLIGPEGLLGKYRKMHLFMNEKDIFMPGEGELEVFDLGGYKIGMQICFDYLFPEPWRLLAMTGADVICHPSNLLTENAQRCIPGLSLMNRVFIVNANRIGTERGISFNGSSLICRPDGKMAAMASPDKEEVISQNIDIDLARNKMVTARNHVFNDRRPEIYG